MATDGSRRWDTVTLGLALVIAGVLLLLSNLEILDIELNRIWPLGLAALGVLFFFSVRGKVHKGAVFPGTLFLLIGLFLFLWENRLIPRGDGTRWPAFLIIVGIAFVVLYIWDRRDRETFVLGIMLTIFGAIFMADAHYYLPWSPWELVFKSWPLLLVLVGISMLARVWERRQKLEMEEVGPRDEDTLPEEDSEGERGV